MRTEWSSTLRMRWQSASASVCESVEAHRHKELSARHCTPPAYDRATQLPPPSRRPRGPSEHSTSASRGHWDLEELAMIASEPDCMSLRVVSKID